MSKLLLGILKYEMFRLANVWSAKYQNTKILLLLEMQCLHTMQKISEQTTIFVRMQSTLHGLL